MKLFIDANVLISVLNKEMPLFNYSSRILSLSNRIDYQLYVTPLSLAISFYFSSKKSGAKKAKEKLRILYNYLHLAEVDHSAVKRSFEQSQVEDLEDGFQYYAALHSGCDLIITENTQDFYFSEIEVHSCESFLKTYLFKQI